MAQVQVLAAGLIALAATACSIVSSHETDLKTTDRRTGVLYMLPKAVLQIQVTDTAGNLAATIFNPILVGDADASYLMSYDASVLASDKVKVEVDPKTSLLQLIDLTAEDKTAEIIKKLAQTAAVIAQAGTTGAEVMLYNKTFDPATERETVEQEINGVIGEYLDEKTAAPCAATDAACVRYRELKSRTVGPDAKPLFTLGVTAPAIVAAAATTGTSEAPPMTDCTIGVCYRPVVPYQISAKLGYRLSSVTVFLPNQAPIVALPLDRFFLVTSTHKVTLRDGLLVSVETTKPSEALALASLPLDVIEAVLGSLTKFTGLEAALTRAQTDRLKAEMEFQKQLALKPQSGTLGGEGSVLLQVTTGSTSIFPANVGGQEDQPSPPPGDGTVPGNPGTGSTAPNPGTGSGTSTGNQ